MRPALTVLGIALTVVLLARALWKGRRPSVVRRLLDALRPALQLAAIAATVIITGVSTPVPFVAIAVAAGLCLGAITGATLDLSIRGTRVMASRSVIGLGVWSVGLVASQVAGLANRAQLLQVGSAVAWFGLATAIGTFVGREPALRKTRASLLSAGCIGAFTVTLATLLSSGAGDDAVASTAPSGWTLVEVRTEDMTSTSFTTITHAPGSIEATVDSEGVGAKFTATYTVPPNQLVGGEQVVLDVTVSSFTSGDRQYFAALDVIQLLSSGWTGVAVNATAECVDPIGDAPLSCTPPMENLGTFVYDVPPPTAGGTFVIGVGALNCQCAMNWIYGPATAPPVDSAVVPPVPVDSGTSTDEAAGGAEEVTPDDEDISDEEALQAAAAGAVIAVLIGLVEMSEKTDPVDGGSDGGSAASIPHTPAAELPPPATADDVPGPNIRPPPDRAVVDAIADQAIQFAQDAIGPLVDYESVYDEIQRLRDRIARGEGQPGDMELLVALRDALWAIGRAERDRTVSAAASEAAVLAALETVLAVEAEFGKAAAGTFGPASAVIYSGFVETVANRDKGMAAALGHGAVGGASALVGTRSGPAIDGLGSAWSALRSGVGGGALNAAEDLGHQAVDSGGDPAAIDLNRTAGSALTGFVTGGAGAAVRPGVHVEVDQWGKTPPQPKLPRIVVEPPAPPRSPVDLSPPAGAPSALPPPPPRILPDTQQVAQRVSTDRAPSDMFPDSPELPPAACGCPVTRMVVCSIRVGTTS